VKNPPPLTLNNALFLQDYPLRSETHRKKLPMRHLSDVREVRQCEPALYNPCGAPHAGLRTAGIGQGGGERIMPTPSETVTTFLAMWEAPGGLDQSVRDYFTPTTLWENVGLAVTTGIDEALALNEQLWRTMGIATIRVDNLAVAEAGSKVLTERIDHMVDAAGRTFYSAPVMGIFELAGGKIAAWRDYFDSAGAARAMQGRGG
jgi:limonene-1,2-epoxide hydrolase